MGAIEDAKPKGAEIEPRKLIRSGILDLVWSRALPAFVFQLILFSKVTALIQRLYSGAEAEAPLLYSASVLQQALGDAFLAMMVVLFVVRRPVAGRRAGRLGAIVAVAGTCVMNLPAGPRITGDSVHPLLVSSALIGFGTVWSIVSLAYLGRCFGIFPEARGLVTRGPYRWIRHPLYLGEITSSLGLVVASASPALFGVFVIFCGLQYWRARLEERVLTQAFPDYAVYARRTARILPGLP